MRRALLSLFAVFPSACGENPFGTLEAECVEGCEEGTADEGMPTMGTSIILSEAECQEALQDLRADFSYSWRIGVPRSIALNNAGPNTRLRYVRENRVGSLLTSCVAGIGLVRAVNIAQTGDVYITEVIHSGSHDCAIMDGIEATEHCQALAIDIVGIVVGGRMFHVNAQWSSHEIRTFRSALISSFEVVLDRSNRPDTHTDHIHATRALSAFPTPHCEITVTTPNGGEQFRIGTEYEIQYSSAGSCHPRCRIDLYRYVRPTQWGLAGVPGVPCSGTYPFEPLPSMLVGDGYTIGIGTLDGLHSDFSNDPFSIVASAQQERPRANREETIGYPLCDEELPLMQTPAQHTYTREENWDLDCVLGERIITPIDGVVLGARDGYTVGGNAYQDGIACYVPGYGNRICVKNDARDLICCLNHLNSGSLRVEAGRTVSRGDYIADCGCSGHVIRNQNEQGEFTSDGSHLDIFCTDRRGNNVNLTHPATWRPDIALRTAACGGDEGADLEAAGFHDDDPPQPDPEPECRPSAERCDGIDNDCDGQVDENQMQTCVSACGLEGQQWCSNGVWGECVNANCAQEPDPRMTDADRDGWTADLDCDDHNPAINRHAREICNNGIDDNCDGRVDERLCDNPAPDPEPEPEPQPGNGTLEITVIYDRAIPALDFSYGYCSDIRDPAQCLHPWNQSVARENNTDRLTWRMEGARGGSIRFNSSFFLDGDNRPDSWLCVGQANPQLTARVIARLDGRDISNAVVAVRYDNGCSAGLVLPND